MELSAKIRYRQTAVPCFASVMNGRSDQVRVEFSSPIRVATLGQIVCLYDGEVCLGGGAVDALSPSYHALSKSLEIAETRKRNVVEL